MPFFVNEADLDCTVLLLTDENVIELALEAPDGTMITETTAPGLGLSVNRGDQTRHFRFTLPVAIGAGQQTGTWYAVLKVNPDEFKKAATRMRRGENKQHFQRFVTHGPRYSVVVQTYSNLRFDVQAQQSSFEPGATLSFQATLSEYGLPVEKRAMLQLELTRPGGGMTTLDLLEGEPGTYQVQSVALSSGVYVGRVLARGVTLRGTPFTREQTVSLAVWKGGDQPVRPPRGSDQTEGCELWKCLLSEEVLRPEFAELMKRWGVDLDALRTCMKKSGHRHSQERTPQ